MKKHFSYSFRQYAHQVQGKETSDVDVSKQLVGLLNKLAYRFDWMTLPHKFHLIAYFFLTVASEPLAYHILVEIYTNYIPNYAIEYINDPPPPFDKKLSMNQKVKIKKISNYLTTQYKYSEAEQKQLLYFIQFFGLEMISTLFVDMLTVEFFFTAINEMITKNTFMEIEKIFIIMARYHRDYINNASITQKEEYQYVLLYLIRNTEFQKLKDMSQEEKNQDQQSMHSSEGKDSYKKKVFQSSLLIANNETRNVEFLTDTEKKSNNSLLIPTQKENKPPQQQFLTPLKQKNLVILKEQENDQNIDIQSQENKILQDEHTLKQNQEEIIVQVEQIKNIVQQNDTQSDSSLENNIRIEQYKEYDNTENSYIDQEKSDIKKSVQYRNDITLDQINLNQDISLKEIHDKDINQQKEQEFLTSEISFIQRQLQKKENEQQEKNEEIQKLQIQIKNFEREKVAINEQLTQKTQQNQQLTQSQNQIQEQNKQLIFEVEEKCVLLKQKYTSSQEKYIKLEDEYGQLNQKYKKQEEDLLILKKNYVKLEEKYTRNEERYEQMESQRKQFSVDYKNNSRLDILWRQFQGLQKKQVEMTEEKVIQEQEFLSQKEQIFIQHLSEQRLLKQQIEEYSKKMIQNEEKYMCEQNEYQKQILIFEKSSEDNKTIVMNQQREINYLNSQILSLKQSESLCRQELSSKSQLLQTYQNIVDNQVKDLNANLEQMRTSNTSNIQEHKTLIELNNQKNDLIFEELKIQILEYQDKIKKQNDQLEQSQSQLTQIQEIIQENSQLKEQLKQSQQNYFEQQTIVSEKETLIYQKDILIIEKEEKINQQEAVIREKEEHIQEKEVQIQSLENRVIEIKTKISQFEMNQKQNEDLIDQFKNSQIEMTTQYKADMDVSQNKLIEEQQQCKEIEKQLEQITLELYQTKQMLEQSEQKNNEIEKQMNDLKVIIENNETQHKDKQDLQQQLNIQNVLIAELNEQIIINKDKQLHEQNQINEQNTQLKNIQNQCQEKQNIISNNQNQIKNLNEVIDKLKQEIVQQKYQLDSKCEEHEKNIKKLKSNLNKVTNELNKYLSIFQSVKQTVTQAEEEDQNQDEDS